MGAPLAEPDPEPLRTITMNRGGLTSQMVISPEDDALTKRLLAFLAKASAKDGDTGSEFPPYRRMEMSYKDFDELLAALGSVVQRERGKSPKLLGYTFGTLRAALESGLLPYRAGAPVSEHRLKQ